MYLLMMWWWSNGAVDYYCIVYNNCVFECATKFYLHENRSKTKVASMMWYIVWLETIAAWANGLRSINGAHGTQNAEAHTQGKRHSNCWVTDATLELSEFPFGVCAMHIRYIVCLVKHQTTTHYKPTMMRLNITELIRTRAAWVFAFPFRITFCTMLFKNLFMD